MTKVSKLSRNGGRLIISVKWVSVRIGTIVSVKRHGKVILEGKKNTAYYMRPAIIFKKKACDSNREDETGGMAVVILGSRCVK